MQSLEAIDYLETLQKGQFLTVNIPILGDDMIKVTAMYIGKDKEDITLLIMVILYYQKIF